jgi:hemerythrin-like domain-containing protein
MGRPILNSFHRIHNAIKGELSNLEMHAKSLDPNSPESVGGFAGHFSFIVGTVQEAHSHEEENTLWPEIEALNPGLMVTFKADHEAERAYVAEIKTNLEKLQGASDKEAAAAGVYRNTVALVSHLHHHMNKEEAIPYSTFSDQLDDDKEFVLIGKILGGLPEEMLPMAMPWWASFQTPEDIADEHETTLKALGPEKAAKFAGPIVNSLSPEKWDAVLKLNPSLAPFRQA